MRTHAFDLCQNYLSMLQKNLLEITSAIHSCFCSESSWSVCFYIVIRLELRNCWKVCRIEIDSDKATYKVCVKKVFAHKVDTPCHLQTVLFVLQYQHPALSFLKWNQAAQWHILKNAMWQRLAARDNLAHRWRIITTANTLKLQNVPVEDQNHMSPGPRQSRAHNHAKRCA